MLFIIIGVQELTGQRFNLCLIERILKNLTCNLTKKKGILIKECLNKNNLECVHQEENLPTSKEQHIATQI